MIERGQVVPGGAAAAIPDWYRGSPAWPPFHEETRVRTPVVHFDVDDPEDLARLVRSGAIWGTPYEQRAVDAIESGLVPLDECQDLPDEVHELLS